MLNSDEILRIIEDNYREIERYGVTKIGVFGSYARGDQEADSDIDILVEFAPGAKSFDNYMDLKFLLEDLSGKKIDLVIAENIKPALKETVLEEVKYAERI